MWGQVQTNRWRANAWGGAYGMGGGVGRVVRTTPAPPGASACMWASWVSFLVRRRVSSSPTSRTTLAVRGQIHYRGEPMGGGSRVWIGKPLTARKIKCDRSRLWFQSNFCPGRMDLDKYPTHWLEYDRGKCIFRDRAKYSKQTIKQKIGLCLCEQLCQLCEKIRLNIEIELKTAIKWKKNQFVDRIGIL